MCEKGNELKNKSWIYVRGLYYSKEIKDNFNYYIDKIREREKCWDIKILDFILANYKEKKLFYDLGHPTNVIMKEISLEIMKKIGIENEKISCDVRMNYQEEPVYPCVRKALSLK